ncbi:MAG: hypothetical protein IPK81_19245 [Rhodospirillales bacterium]|nr:MAG: hypothetical protein IPK81_19245 [Rhodospirillales bacterium]
MDMSHLDDSKASDFMMRVAVAFVMTMVAAPPALVVTHGLVIDAPIARVGLLLPVLALILWSVTFASTMHQVFSRGLLAAAVSLLAFPVAQAVLPTPGPERVVFNALRNMLLVYSLGVGGSALVLSFFLANPARGKAGTGPSDTGRDTPAA